MVMQRRRFLGQMAALSSIPVAGALLPSLAAADSEADAGTAAGMKSGSVTLADGELLSLSDGHLTLPVDFILPAAIDKGERTAFLASHGIGPEQLTPPCNLTLWRTAERQVLFDAGAGSRFMPGAGRLPDSLAAAGVDPAGITDVVLTHAHPDHLWGVIDDFDELAFPEATYHLHRREHAYWLADKTLAATPDARKPFVVGAADRLPLLDQQLSLFDWGDEIVPGIEAVDTQGHTPGHTSFVVHAGSDSVVVLGDALTHAAISFERPAWPSGSDQDPQQGIRTRLALLDRLAGERSAIIGFHLDAPGFGRVERAGDGYRFAALAG